MQNKQLLNPLILNKLFHTIRRSIFDFRYMYVRLYDVAILKEKMVELFANSGDPNQMLYSAMSDLGLLCVPVTRLEVSSLQWVNGQCGLSHIFTSEVDMIHFQGRQLCQIFVLPSEKDSTLKRKEIAPFGTNFPFRVDHFRRGLVWCTWKQTGSHKSFPLSKIMENHLCLNCLLRPVCLNTYGKYGIHDCLRPWA